MRRFHIIAAVAALAGITILSTSSHAREYRIEPLENLGGGYARARAVNNAGKVVGEALLPVAGTVERAFSYSDGLCSDLGTLGGTRSRATDVNLYGYVSGWALDANGATKPVYWDDLGNIHQLDTLGGRYGTAWAISDSGLVAGNAYVNDSVYRAALWSDLGVQDLGTLGGNYSIAYDVNDYGVVAGGADDGTGKQRACLWFDGAPVSIANISGGVWDTIRGINNSGEVILWGKPSGATKNRAAFWSGVETDPVLDLGTFGGDESWAYGLNSHGWTVGWAEDASGFYRAFVHDGVEMTDLGTLGGRFSSAYGINDDGVIVGYAQNAYGQWESVQWIPVPEPSSLTVLLGLMVLGPTALRRGLRRH